MKVLFTYYISSGGMETLNRHRCKALRQAGIECHLLYKEQGSGHPNITGIKTFLMKKTSEISALVKREQYDLIVVCTDHQLLRSIKRSGYVGKLVFELQGLGDYRFTERFFIRHKSLITKAADAILIPKTTHLIQLAKKYLSALPLFSFHNCFDVNSFHHVPVAKTISPIAGWVGRIEKNKKWDLFLEIGKRLIERNGNIKLWMFIDDSLYEPSQKNLFTKTIDKWNLSHNLTVYKNIRNDLMPGYYSQIADSGGLLCSTSKIEGFGYTLVEAMSCGCPILTTDSDGIRSIVENNVTGMIIRQSSIEDAISKAERIMKNANLRKRLTRNGYNRIRSIFSLENYADEFMKMYWRL